MQASHLEADLLLAFKVAQGRQALVSRQALAHQRLLLKLPRSPALRAAVGCQLRGAPAWRVRARVLGHTTLMARRPWVSYPSLVTLQEMKLSW